MELKVNCVRETKLRQFRNQLDQKAGQGLANGGSVARVKPLV